MQIPLDILQRCWFLAGPTACGKTQVALRLAGLLDAEIVSLDSMALYRGMDIGTAKPTADEQKLVPHHLIDVIDPHEEYTVAEYVEAANDVCRGISERGRTPLFVGGTGLYLRSLLRGVFEGPAADWEFRKELERVAAENGPEELMRRLREKDPPTAERLHPNDLRRVIRALEVVHLTGRPLSEQHQQSPLPAEQQPRHVYWLNPDRAWLHDRVNRRVTGMVEAGLVDEVRALLAASRPMSRTARQALGYKEVIAAIDGDESMPDAVDLIRTRTRQFAKRQCTWFRNLEECTAVSLDPKSDINEIAQRLAEQRACDKP